MACKICTHSKRSEIDAALIQSESLRSVAKRFAVSEGSVFRHGKKHVAATIAVAKQAKNIEIGEGLISEVRSLHARALGILAKAEAAGHLDVPCARYVNCAASSNCSASLTGSFKSGAARSRFRSCTWTSSKSSCQPQTYTRQSVFRTSTTVILTGISFRTTTDCGGDITAAMIPHKLLKPHEFKFP